MFRRFLMLAALGAPLVLASSFSISIGDKVQVGSAQLKPGDYSVSVKGSTAVFTDENGHRTEAAVTMGTADHKFKQTSVVCSKTGDASRLEYIGLKGGNQELVFNK